jgi:hypothetical protein
MPSAASCTSKAKRLSPRILRTMPRMVLESSMISVRVGILARAELDQLARGFGIAAGQAWPTMQISAP